VTAIINQTLCRYSYFPVGASATLERQSIYFLIFLTVISAKAGTRLQRRLPSPGFPAFTGMTDK
jgi:hypothetical protein